ncbi:MAG: tRNA (cytidine(34)-2'-O)-methyltransferase [Pseudomonadota bacterium]
MLRIGLYQPDIPQNTGTIVRLGACLGVAVDIIGPAGFAMTDKAFRRAGMDYLERATVTRHLSWEAFRASDPVRRRRLVLLTTQADLAYTDFTFHRDDTLLLGRESAGVPDTVHASVADRIRIPMQSGTRSLNVALACAMVLGEALRQTAGFPAHSA